MRVLIVEDHDLLRESLATGLREAGFAVDTADDGETGLWHARSGNFDAVILDIMLPKMTGLEVLRSLRKIDTKTPVLVLTAKDTTDDRVRGLDFGADDYLVKPFAFPELLARVRALVRRRYDAKSPTLQVDDLEIDTLTRSAKRAGQTVPLSAREFALLEFLALRANQVVTRTDIAEHLYESDSDPDSNVVDVFVAHLRRKLERPDLPKLIHTRRGHGYLLGKAEE